MNGEHLEAAVVEIAGEVHSIIRKRPRSPWDENRLREELACCLLSSQVRYVDAQAFASQLAIRGLLYKGRVQVQCMEDSICNCLSTPLSVNGGLRKYRFATHKGIQLAQTIFTIECDHSSLSKMVGSTDSTSIREYMVHHLAGIGPKQASMFLRNVGISYDLAILDRHVLRYMGLVGLGKASPPRTFNEYLHLELNLRQYSASMGYPVGLMDWAIWIVMRAAGEVGMA